MASPNGIKMEDATYIKPEPGTAEADGGFEDTGDLEIHGDAQSNQAWLVKIPDYLWEVWANAAEDEEVEIGKVRVYNDPNPDGSQRLKIMLHDNAKQHDIPKLYNGRITKGEYNNTIAFSEKDQPGFRSGAWNRNRMPKKQDTKPDPNRVNKQKGYRSSIPKQTALAAYFQNEVSLTAVENAEYNNFTKNRFKQMFQPKHQTAFVNDINVNNQHAIKSFSNFVTAKEAAPKKKKQQEKAVRISQDVLLDQLQKCFKEYRYWSLRALRQRLHQPEQYIKQTLEKIATLQRSGQFAMNYKLNPEYEQINNDQGENIKEEVAKEEESDDDVKDEPDDEDVFEDVDMA